MQRLTFILLVCRVCKYDLKYMCTTRLFHKVRKNAKNNNYAIKKNIVCTILV